MKSRDGPDCRYISSQVFPLDGQFHGRVILSVITAPAEVVNSVVVQWPRWKLAVGVAIEDSEARALARAREQAFAAAQATGNQREAERCL